MARAELGKLQRRIERLPPDGDGSRTVDYEFIEPGLGAHVQMIATAVLTMRYFVLEVERIVELGPPANRTDDLDRFRRACTGAGLADPASHAHWSTLGELIEMRHLVEHPTQDTIYSVHQWDRVPLAWSLTGRALECFDAFDLVFGEMATAWETRKGDFAKPATLQVVSRGLRARRPAKNPPRPASDPRPEPPADA